MGGVHDTSYPHTARGRLARRAHTGRDRGRPARRRRGSRQARQGRPAHHDEIAHLLDIFTSPARFSSVDYGDEVVLSFDGSGNSDLNAPILEQLVYQNHHGADMIELWHQDYSYKAVRTVLSFQTQMLKDAQLQTVVPLNYGAMPDLGRYSMPDGPAPTGPSCCRWARWRRPARPNSRR